MNQCKMTEVARNLKSPLQSTRKYNQKTMARCNGQQEKVRVQGRVREPRA